MNILDLTPYLALALSAIAVLTQLKTILSSGEKKLEERMVKAEDTLIKHDRRIQTIEGDMKHLPDRETTHRLEIAMERISGRLDTIDEKLKPIKSTGDMLTELLLDQAKDQQRELKSA